MTVLRQRVAFYFGLGVLFVIGLFVTMPVFNTEPMYQPFSIAAVTIARAESIAAHGFAGWFPDWYLGTPQRLLGSPLVPGLLAAVTSIFPALSLWQVYRWVVGLSIALVPAGVGWLAFRLNTKKTRVEAGLLAGVLMLLVPGLVFVLPSLWPVGKTWGFWPWSVISGFFLGNGVRVAGLVVTLWSLGLAFHWLAGRPRAFFAAVITGWLALLIDVSVLPTFLVGLGLMAVSFWMTGKHSENYLRRAAALVLVILGGLAWVYSPRFWWWRLSAPSLAGKRTLAVGLFATRFLSIAIPFLLAFLTAKKTQKNRSFGGVFSLLWLLTFGLLTIGRWLADTDFWQDYTAWGMELSAGLALFLGVRLGRSPGRRQFAVIAVLSALGSVWLSRWPGGLTAQDQPFTGFVARHQPVLSEFVAPADRVFASGGLVFWLEGVPQVRGGLDAGAVYPWWAHAAYQIREGTDGRLAADWLRALGTSWILVHWPDSADPYHDFASPEKFIREEFELAWSQDGNRLFHLADTGLARTVTDAEAFFSLPAPTAGNDASALAKYNLLINGLMPLRWQNKNSFIIDVPAETPAVSVAVSFDKGWRATQAGRSLKVLTDALGQIAFVPAGPGTVEFTYFYPSFDQALGVALSVLVWLGLAGRFGTIRSGPRSSTDRAAAS